MKIAIPRSSPNRVLLVVLDGMSWAVCHELLEDIRQDHWFEATLDLTAAPPAPVLLLILKDSGYSGLVLVLDEIETLQRVRTDVREKGLNALRQLIDDIDSGRFPNLYLLITGTPAFFDGPQGMQRLEPLAQRLHVDFQTEARFDNPRAVQLRLAPFDHDRLVEVGTKVRDLYSADCQAPERVRRLANQDYIEALARAITGKLGGKVGIAPRLFLKKLVSDVLDRIDQHDNFDPRKHYQLTVTSSEMSPVERESQAQTVDDIELDP